MFKRARRGAEVLRNDNNPLTLQLAANEGPVKCSATVVDTMLLSPAGTSLEALGKLLGLHKIDLPEGYFEGSNGSVPARPSRRIRGIRACATR